MVVSKTRNLCARIPKAFSNTPGSGESVVKYSLMVLQVSDGNRVHQVLVDPKALSPTMQYGTGTSSPDTGIVAGTIRADINPEKLVVCVDQGHEDNGEEALVVSVHRASIPRTVTATCSIQSTTAVWKLPSLLKLLDKGGPLFVLVGHWITSAANSALMASQTSLTMREMVFGAILKL
ncbi:hypothetical protein BSL78_02472 [Apostichopus japonicus]|uniref:Uncharacterized protein n=1 Tax=Stichopus japonicus TaxID=307972 RepID=A0A2G8LK38_STIJA|nr:hypothetical protein BSL78_02472 [Apostichopus japonicus]